MGYKKLFAILLSAAFFCAAFCFCAFAANVVLANTIGDLNILSGDAKAGGGRFADFASREQNFGCISLSKTYQTPRDLSQYEEIFFEIDFDECGYDVYTLTLSLFSEQDSATYTKSYPAGKSTAFFSLEDFAGTSALTNFTIVIGANSGGDTANITGSIGKIYAGKSDISDFTNRFLCSSFDARTGAEIKFEDNAISTDFSGTSDYIQGFVAADKPYGGTNAVRIMLSGGSELANIKLYYAFGISDAFVSANSVTLSAIRDDEMHAYLFPISSSDDICKIRIAFVGGDLENIKIHSVCRVSIFEKSEGALGELSECSVSDDGSYISLKGNIELDDAGRYKGYNLALYRLPTYANLSYITENKLAPVASVKISAKFEFKIPLATSGGSSLLSKYAVVLENNGVPDLSLCVGTQRYVTEVENLSADTPEFSSANKFKGIKSDDLFENQNVGAGTVVIDVDASRIMSDGKTGYLHTAGGKYYYFDLDYVDELDKKIVASGMGETEILLRIIAKNPSREVPYTFASDISGVEYYALRADNDESIAFIHALIDFLTYRYSQSLSDCLTGFIVGKSIDIAGMYNYMGVNISQSEYAENYLRVFRIAAGSAKARNKNIKIYLPMSDAQAKEVILPLWRGADYDNSLLLETFLGAMSAMGEIDFNLLWENSQTPSIDNGDDKPLAVARQTAIIKKLASEYSCVPKSSAFFWQPQSDLTAEKLEAEYARLYYSLFFSDETERFIISFENQNLGASVSHLMKYIDTPITAQVSENALKYFSAATWRVLVPEWNASACALREIAEATMQSGISPTAAGKFEYVSFPSLWDTRGFQRGEYCSDIYITSSDLQQNYFTAEFENTESYMGIFKKFDIPENMNYAPQIAFDLQIDGGAAEYDVIITIGNGEKKFEGSAKIQSGVRRLLTLDLSSFSGVSSVDCIKLWIRPVGSGGGEKLSLFGVTGYSEYMSDGELEAAIIEARKSTVGESGDFEFERARQIAIVVCVGAAVTIFMLLLLGTSEKKKPDEKKKGGRL